MPRLKSEKEAEYKATPLKTEKPKEKPSIRCSQDAYRFIKTIIDPSAFEEHFAVLCLNVKNEVVDSKVIAIGDTNECRVTVRPIFRHALLSGCARILLAHNHPSGDSTPSPDDVALTKRIVRGAELLDFTILDHIVLGENSYTSFLDLGIMVNL
jgi:DNA repair protein RadC